MTRLLTCKNFLSELTDYLDEEVDAELKAKLEEHMQSCPDCWVLCDTTRKTVQIFRGQDKACSVPPEVQARLMAAMERRMAARAGELKQA